MNPRGDAPGTTSSSTAPALSQGRRADREQEARAKDLDKRAPL
jgi:hypothetical protein